MKKRFLSALLALTIMGTLSPVPVHAAEADVLDGEDVTSELLPDSLWDQFRLYSLPQVKGTYSYRDVDSVRWLGSTLLYEYQNSYGLLDKTGKAVTGPLYDGYSQIGSSDFMYLNLKDGSGKHILHSETGELYDVVVDAGGTITDYSLAEMIVFPENGAATVVSYSGKVLKRWLTNISSYEALAPGCIAIRNSSGLYAVLNESGMTDFVYSKIGLHRTPYASNGMVYAERNGIAGFINLETLEEVAFRYDTGYLVTASGLVASSYRGNYAVVHRQDPDTYDSWYGILDKTGKEIISVDYDTYILGGGDSIFYHDAELVYYQDHREKLHLLTLSDSGLSVKELGNYSKFFTHTTASGTTYSGVFTAFDYGVMEIQDNTTKELVLINAKGQELLRGYDRLEAKKNSDSTQLTCIVAWDTNGKCAYYVPGGTFSDYSYDSISVSHGYIEAGTTEEDGTTWYRLFTPYGTELFPGIKASWTYVNPEENYANIGTDDGSYYFCQLSSQTCTGPYDDFASLGQNRYLIQYAPFTVINGKGEVIMDEILGYIGDFRAGYALYTPEGSSYSTGLIDINGEIVDFGFPFDARLLDDAPYGIFCDNTAIIEISGDFYLLHAESGAYETPDPQLLYSSPVSDTLGLPLFDTITLTFDRPVTLPAEDQIRLVCRGDDSELAVSAYYGNKSETVIRVKLKDTVLSCDERYSLYIDEDAVWPQSGEEIKAFSGFTEPDDFTFGIGKDGVYLSDLDLMRYFPTHLKNDTASSFEQYANDAYVDIINTLSATDDLRISYFHALRDPVDAFVGYLPGVSKLRHTELVESTTYNLMCAISSQQANSELANQIGAWSEAITWSAKMSQDEDFVAALNLLLKPNDVDCFVQSLEEFESLSESVSFAADMGKIIYTMVTTELMNRMLIEQLRDAIPYNCQLKQGLTNMLASINKPDYLATKYLLNDQLLKTISDTAEMIVFSEAGKIIGANLGTDAVFGGGVTMFGKLILTNVSNVYELLGNATYEEVNELLILSGFTPALWSAVNIARQEIIQTGEACTLDTAGRYEILYNAYLQALKLTLRAAANFAAPTEMNGDVSLRNRANALADELENGGYSFRVYMDLCKKSALNQASDEYLYDVMQKSNTITLLGSPAAAQLLSISDETEEAEDTILYLPNQVDGYPVSTVGQGVWTGDTSITVLVIPDSVTELSDGAFAGCTSLEQVVFGSGLEHIGANAFLGCSALTSIYLPENLKSIGSNAFDDCSSLCQVTVSSNVVQADDGAFPEDILFCGTEISSALALAEQFFGYEVLSSALEQQPEVLVEPYRYYYAPWEQPDGTGMLLDADGEVVSDNWVLCCDTSEPGEQKVTVHYLGQKTSFQICVGEDELHFPTPYHLQIPTWDEGTAIAAAYDEHGQMTEALVFPEAYGTVYDLPWKSEPASVKGFFLNLSHVPLSEFAECVP